MTGQLKSIGEEAFKWCDALVSITFKGSVKSIGQMSFYACSSLTDVTLPEGLTSLDSGAFASCGNMKSVSIPGSVKNIGNGSFANCGNLTKVVCYAENVPATKKDAFINSAMATATLYVPEGSVEKYQKSSPWSNFGSIKAIGDDTVIGADETGIDSPTLTSLKEEGQIFNLAGQRISKPAHGIYLKNGKKVLMK